MNAIKMFERSIECLQDADRNGYSADVIKAYQEAIEALKKQEPKKVPSQRWCMSCGKIFLYDKPSYCHNCGQKLDWEEK